MSSEIRWPLRVALLHTGIVVVAVGTKNGLHGTRAAVAADRMLRLVDAPVLWIVDVFLQSFSLPAQWFSPSIYVALGIHEALVYGTVGASFYAIVCWMAIRVIRRRTGARQLPQDRR
jgi:uncharacterized membrane protein (DUF2068 family)